LEDKYWTSGPSIGSSGLKYPVTPPPEIVERMIQKIVDNREPFSGFLATFFFAN
jgi:hypothetical protein